VKTRTWPVYGVLLAALWVFVRSVPATPRLVLAEFLVGLLFGLPVAYAFRRFFSAETDVGRGLRAVPYAVLYAAAFLRQLVTANVDVAYRVLAPSMPIEPAVIVVPLRVETDLAITTIANSITLTPGTLTMDYDHDTNALYVHAIAGRDRDSVVSPIRAWEDYALVIFDEPKKPGDPVPELPAEIRQDGGAAADDAGRGDALDDADASSTRDAGDDGGDRDGD
jgi:multicomponent Na+:H+ antiporter subunit E